MKTEEKYIKSQTLFGTEILSIECDNVWSRYVNGNYRSKEIICVELHIGRTGSSNILVFVLVAIIVLVVMVIESVYVI